MSDNLEIDCADHIFHSPSGEDWTVAAVEDGHVYWMGYPLGGYGELVDCALLRKATPNEKNKVLAELVNSNSNARPVILARA